MKKTIAIANKSGKEFEVSSIGEEVVVLKNTDGTEKEIKASTFKRGYTTKEVEVPDEVKEEEVVENTEVITEVENTEVITEVENTEVKDEVNFSHEESKEQSNFVPEESVSDESEVEILNELDFVCNASNAIEEAIVNLLKEHPMECDIERPNTEKDAIRIRDNSRQAFKENETRFRRAHSDLETTAVRADENPEDTFAKEEVEDLRKVLVKYIEKMKVYYTRYLLAKDSIDFIRAEEEQNAKTLAEHKTDFETAMREEQ